jgi:hypothetical protein
MIKARLVAAVTAVDAPCAAVPSRAQDMTGLEGTNFEGADLNAARIRKLKNRNAAKNLDKAKNYDKALLD